VFVENPGSHTFKSVQTEPFKVPERARHRQIKRICDHLMTRRTPSREPFRIVEVGAGWGGLAQVFARDSRYQYVGFEPSASRAAYCRARGFDVREALFNDCVDANSADGVVFDNVLEHVENPDALVRAARTALIENGVLVVIVPNLNDIRQLNRGWRQRHHWQPHCHINYFSARDLGSLFERHGLKCRFFGFEAIGKLGDDVSLLPRVMADSVGLHVLGLNCYGIKSNSG
jgi:SAM-dependent methyltransferase